MTDLSAILAGIATQMNGVPEGDARAARHAALVLDTNARVAATADVVLTLDATPVSFAAFKNESLPAGEQES
jgi:hypothetical protein